MNVRPLTAAGTLMGIGMGGFVDGILFHQIFQLHSMLSAKLPLDSIVNIKVNMVWDGLFHAMVWLATAVGIKLLWNVGRRTDVPWSGKIFFGSLVMGWGIFNLIEGIIDHQILGIHHVVEARGLSVFDYMFLASGMLFIAIGLIFIRSGSRDAASA